MGAVLLFSPSHPGVHPVWRPLTCGVAQALIMSSLSILLCWLDDSPHRFLGEAGVERVRVQGDGRRGER